MKRMRLTLSMAQWSVKLPALLALVATQIGLLASQVTCAAPAGTDGQGIGRKLVPCALVTTWATITPDMPMPALWLYATSSLALGILPVCKHSAALPALKVVLCLADYQHAQCMVRMHAEC